MAPRTTRRQKVEDYDSDDFEDISDEVREELMPKPKDNTLISKVVSKLRKSFPALKKYSSELESLALAVSIFYVSTIGVNWLKKSCVRSGSFLCQYRDQILFFRNQLTLDNIIKYFVKIQDGLLDVLQSVFSVIGLNKLFPVIATFLKGTFERFFRQEENAPGSFSLRNLFFKGESPKKNAS